MAYLVLAESWFEPGTEFAWHLFTSSDRLNLGCRNVRETGEWVACWRAWGHEGLHLGRVDVDGREVDVAWGG